MKFPFLNLLPCMAHHKADGDGVDGPWVDHKSAQVGVAGTDAGETGCQSAAQIEWVK